MKTFRNAFGGTLGVIVAIIGITPQFLDDVGIFMDGVYGYIPQWGWVILSLLIFIALWVWNKVEDIQEQKSEPIPPTSNNYQQEIEDSGLGFQANTFNAPVSIVQSENSKEKDRREIIYPRTFYHQDFDVKGNTADNVLNFIRNDVSSGLWNINDGNKILYHVNHEETDFYYPDKHNTPVHGAFFTVIKNGKHFHKCFWISIESSGIRENISLTINFETNDKDAIAFFDVLKSKVLGKFHPRKTMRAL